MTLEMVVLNCEIFPEKKAINGNVLLKFSEIPEQLELLLNPDLKIKNCYIKVGKEKFENITITEEDIPNDSLIKTAKLMSVKLPSKLKKADNEFFYFEADYLGQILKSEWDLSRIEDDFV